MHHAYDESAAKIGPASSIASDPTILESSDNLRYPLSTICRHREGDTEGLLSALADKDALTEFITLSQSLIQMEPKPSLLSRRSSPSIVQSPFVLAATDVSLTDLTSYWFTFEPDSRLDLRSDSVGPSMDEMSTDWGSSKDSAESEYYHEALGDLWYALGKLVLRASEATAGKSTQLMRCVHLMLAEMHSQGLVPTDIYGFEESEVLKPSRKPPYLHLLGSRIMATLSDSAWKAISAAPSEGQLKSAQPSPETIYDSPDPRVRKLHPNVWFELILWCCIRHSHFVVAAKLLSLACLSQEPRNWTTLTWDQVLESQTDHEQRHQSWFNRVMTLAEGYSEARPLVEMPPNTISSEAVLTVLDGLLSLPDDLGNVRSARRIAFYIYCRSLPTDYPAHESLKLRAIAQDFLQTADMDPVILGQLLVNENLMDDVSSSLSRTRPANDDPEKRLESQAFSTALLREQPTPMFSYLIGTLDAQVSRGQVGEALVTLDQIRRVRYKLSSAVDVDSELYYDLDMYPRINGSSDSAHASQPLVSNLIRDPGARIMNIPDRTLSDLLILLVGSGNLDALKTIVHKDNFLPKDISQNAVLRPGILQAAVALADKNLLQEAIKGVKENFRDLSENVLCAMFDLQIGLQNIRKAYQVLEVISNERSFVLPLQSVAVVACEYIKLQRSRGIADRIWYNNVQMLMCDILNGKYIPYDPSKPLDYVPHRELSQLSRVIQAALGPKRQLKRLVKHNTIHPLNNPIAIPPHVFNLILEALVTTEGSDSALAFFNRWCSLEPPARSSDLPKTIEGIPVVQPLFEGAEKVVQPNVESVHIIIEPALESLREFHERNDTKVQRDPTRRLLRWVGAPPVTPKAGERFETELPTGTPNRSILEWGAHTLRQLGLDKFGINEIIPGAFPSI